jgi:SAM-dependent methyltransferase
VEWFRELYDDFRQRTGFGSIPAERTAKDIDFIIAVCDLEPNARVLDICSGTGRHSIELERRGIRATGFELNSEYVALAEERAKVAGVTPSLMIADVRAVDFGTGFDAAILMWHSFGYFSDAEDLALLKKVRNALRPGGRLVLEVLNRDYLLDHFRAKAESEVDGVQVVEEREFDAATNRMKSTIIRHETSAVVTRRTDWHLYSLDELSELGRQAALSLVAAYGDLERNPAGPQTRLMRLVFIRGK